MTRAVLKQARALFLLGLLVGPGCGRRPPARPAEAERPSPRSVPHEIGGSKITLADANGRWTFEVQAKRIEAASLEGPFRIESARCRYEEVGRPAVLMRAARGQVDKRGGRVVLEGSVWIKAEAWELEGERVEYDLKAGKVVAPGRTKWSLVSGRGAGEKSEEKR